MKRNRGKNSFLIVLSVTLLFGCAQRHSHIPRVHHFSNMHTKILRSGHYVQPNQRLAVTTPQPKLGTELEKVNSSIDLIPTSKLSDVRLELDNLKKPLKKPQWRNDSITKADTLSPYDVDQKLIKGSGTMFAIASGMNAALLITPLYNFLNIGLLLGLALLVIGYFVFKFVENTKQNRIQPIKYRAKSYAKRSQVKKAFNILMIISGSAFSLALMTAATGSFGLPIFFSAIGLIALWGGLIVGLVYLIMGA